MKWYAGIGSRETPRGMCRALEMFARRAHMAGYRCRSGGAVGADAAFESGDPDTLVIGPHEATEEALATASVHHPAWHACNDYARRLHGRNVQIILGPHLNQPALFVICWTNAPPRRGGTRLGMDVARANQIPVFNLAEDAALMITEAFGPEGRL